ncbi:hypothetical protein IE077_003889, partial [Cardiosporidium cionae]
DKKEFLNQRIQLFQNFFDSIWEIEHEYIIHPDSLECCGKIFLSLIPTYLETTSVASPYRCWSAWGNAHYSSEENSKSLPASSFYIHIFDLKAIFSEAQLHCIFKWMEHCIFLYSTWQAGILADFEKPRAIQDDAKKYLTYWPLKLLQKDASARIDLFCTDFEDSHSLQTITILRNQAYRKIKEVWETKRSNDLTENVSFLTSFIRKIRGWWFSSSSILEQEVESLFDPEKLANAGVKLLGKVL